MPPIQELSIPGYTHVYRVPLPGCVAFVAIDTLIENRSFGGIRIRDYDDENLALEDALALARAMSRKSAMASIAGGGAKTVVMSPPQSQRRDALTVLAEFVESLEGRYFCGGDLGFEDEDLETVRAATAFVADGDLAPHSAESIHRTMCAVLSPEKVAIQGLGAIGRHLALRLEDDAVTVIGSDLRPVEGVETVPPEQILDVDCDVFAPCAGGGLLDREAVERLRCRLVCGGANNPLANEHVADRLHQRGILYVPDFISNAGALVVGASLAIGELASIESRLQNLEDVTREVLDRSKKEDRSPHHVAIDMADERLLPYRSN